MWTCKGAWRGVSCVGVRDTQCATPPLLRVLYRVAGCTTTTVCVSSFRSIHDPRVRHALLLAGVAHPPITTPQRSFSFLPRLSDIEQLVEATKGYSPGQALRPAPPPAAADTRPFGSLNRSHRSRYYVNVNALAQGHGANESHSNNTIHGSSGGSDTGSKNTSIDSSKNSESHDCTSRTADCHSHDAGTNHTPSNTDTVNVPMPGGSCAHDNSAHQHSSTCAFLGTRESTFALSTTKSAPPSSTGAAAGACGSSCTIMSNTRLLRNNNHHKDMATYRTGLETSYAYTNGCQVNTSDTAQTKPAPLKRVHATKGSADTMNVSNIFAAAGGGCGGSSKQHVYQERCVMGWSLSKFYRVVADVECYQEFLPWCAASRVHSRQRTGLNNEDVKDFASVRNSTAHGTHNNDEMNDNSHRNDDNCVCDTANTLCSHDRYTNRTSKAADLGSASTGHAARQAAPGTYWEKTSKDVTICADDLHRRTRDTIEYTRPITWSAVNATSTASPLTTATTRVTKATYGAHTPLNARTQSTSRTGPSSLRDVTTDGEALELLMATLTVGLSFFTESYTSKVLLVPGRRIVAVLHQRDVTEQHVEKDDSSTHTCNTRPQGMLSSWLHRAAHMATTMALRSSILQNLRCEWSFREVPGCPNAVEVLFDVSFQFVNPMYSKMIMTNIVSIMTRSFERRCEQLYGPPSEARRGLPLQPSCDPIA